MDNVNQVYANHNYFTQLSHEGPTFFLKLGKIKAYMENRILESMIHPTVAYLPQKKTGEMKNWQNPSTQTRN